MPWSDDCFDAHIERFMASMRPKSILDIGAGAGKYGKIARRACPDAWSVAVEAQDDYVEHFGLTRIYDEVRVGLAEEMFFDEPDLTTDLVIFGDCIEHMRKSAGVDLLHFFAYRSRAIICVYPTKYVQYSLQGRAAESHISVWGKHDFLHFEAEHCQRGIMNLTLVTGFLADPEATLVAENGRPLGPPT